MDSNWGKIPETVFWHKHTCVCTHVRAHVFPHTGVGRKGEGRRERQRHSHLSSAANLLNSLASQCEPRRFVCLHYLSASICTAFLNVCVGDKYFIHWGIPPAFLCLFSKWSTWQQAASIAAFDHPCAPLFSPYVITSYSVLTALHFCQVLLTAFPDGTEQPFLMNIIKKQGAESPCEQGQEVT